MGKLTAPRFSYMDTGGAARLLSSEKKFKSTPATWHTSNWIFDYW
jgi:hypothetical protein